MKNKRPLWYYLLPLVSLVLVLVGWLYMAAAKPLLFPSPAETWQRLIKLIEVPLARVPLYQHILISLRRVLGAVTAACVLGVIFGLLVGWSRTFRATLGSIFEILRPIPPIAWIPLITVWLGIGELPKMLIIFIGTFTIVVTNTYTGVAMVDPLTLSVGRVFGASRRQLLMEFVLPAALPAIFAGIRMAIGVGWAIVLAAEMVGASAGVGFLIFRGNELRDMPLIFVCMFIIGSIGALLSAGASWLERRLCPWRP
ncbi:MAG TPA: ABC transporter permease [Candidatus Fournierella merdigallinarum]|nr:ABC transporter permease [Candidatus Fournierella merdigallinarum]